VGLSRSHPRSKSQKASAPVGFWYLRCAGCVSANALWGVFQGNPRARTDLGYSCLRADSTLYPRSPSICVFFPGDIGLSVSLF
jgi:hypothetical protein